MACFAATRHRRQRMQLIAVEPGHTLMDVAHVTGFSLMRLAVLMQTTQMVPCAVHAYCATRYDRLSILVRPSVDRVKYELQRSSALTNTS